MAESDHFEFAFEDAEAQAFLKKILRNANKVGSAAKDYATLVSAFVFQDIMDHFEQEQGSGGRWAPWSKSYQKKMDEKGKGGNKILQDSGHLRQSFRPVQFRVSSEAITWYNPAKTKSGFPYAAAHNTGGPKLPKRDFMWLGDKAQKNIETATLEFLTRDV
jgi:phage gpG-like protein